MNSSNFCWRLISSTTASTNCWSSGSNVLNWAIECVAGDIMELIILPDNACINFDK